MNTDGNAYIDWLDRQAEGLQIPHMLEHVLKVKLFEGGGEAGARVDKALAKELKQVTLTDFETLPDGAVVYRFTSTPPKRKRTPKPCPRCGYVKSDA